MRRRATRLLVSFGVVSAALLVGSASASATFHLMQIRELYLGDNADTRTEYVELQMWAPFQSFVGGHSLTYYNSAGALIATQTFSSNVPNGNNQADHSGRDPARRDAIREGLRSAHHGPRSS